MAGPRGRRWRRRHRLRRARGGWRRRWGRSDVGSARGERGCHRYLIALRVHALLIGKVIAALDRRAGVHAGIGAGRAAEQQAAPGASRGAQGRIACRGADSGSQPSSQQRADGRAPDRALHRRISGGRAALPERPLAAGLVIGLEDLEGLVRPRQDHHVRAGGDGRACPEQGHADEQQPGDLPLHRRHCIIDPLLTLRSHLHPPVRTRRHRWIVAAETLAVVPELLGRRALDKARSDRRTRHDDRRRGNTTTGGA